MNDVGLAKIRYIILLVADLENSLAFYRDALGMTVKRTIPDFADLNGGGVTLTLRRSPRMREQANPHLTKIVFEVPDIHATYRSLKSKGIVFSREPRVVTGDAARDLLATDFRDPDGHVLSITSWVPKTKHIQAGQ